MIKTDTLEGIVDDFKYHFDLTNDVLYLRRSLHPLSFDWHADTYAEEIPDEFLLLRRRNTDEIAGLTVINCLRQSGIRESDVDYIPDSIIEIEQLVEMWVRKLADKIGD